jgi:hypothetical protein
MAKDNYEYEPLPDPRYIRLIYLHPAKDFSDPFVCRLMVISLDDHLEWDGDYTAVSYSWEVVSPEGSL